MNNVFITHLDATSAGGAAIALTPSPLTVVEGDDAVITFLIVLVNDSLNVTANIVVNNDYDGPLSDPLVVDRSNDMFDVIFSGLPQLAFFNVELFFRGNRLTTDPIEVTVDRE